MEAVDGIPQYGRCFLSRAVVARPRLVSRDLDDGGLAHETLQRRTLVRKRGLGDRAWEERVLHFYVVFSECQLTLCAIGMGENGAGTKLEIEKNICEIDYLPRSTRTSNGDIRKVLLIHTGNAS